MPSQNQTALSILRRKQVEQRTGLCRSAIYEQVSKGSFPSPISLGTRAVGWVEGEVQGWIAEQVKKSRGV